MLDEGRVLAALLLPVRRPTPLLLLLVLGLELLPGGEGGEFPRRKGKCVKLIFSDKIFYLL